MDASRLIPQIVVILVFLGVVAFFTMRSLKRKTPGSVQPGLDALRAGFMQSRAPDESDPVCVVAFQYSMMSVAQVTVGVTNRRVLVVKGTGHLHSFAYDHEGEHLPSAQKTKEQRGFFQWSHGPSGYTPTVKHHPPFAGEEWLMVPVVQGFPEQKANLREFASRFYFQWFYD